MSKALGNIGRLIAKILIIIAIVAAIAYGLEFNFEIFGMMIEGSQWLYIALGSFALAFLVDAETAEKAVYKVAQAAKSIASGAGEVIGGVMDGAVKALSPLLPWIFGGALIYFTVIKEDDPTAEIKVTDAN